MSNPATGAALRRYQIIAYIVGTFLILLLPIGVPLKHFADQPIVVMLVGPLHGFLYMVYLAFTVDLARRVPWQLKRTLIVMLAGTIPFVSFIAERKVTRALTASVPELASDRA